VCPGRRLRQAVAAIQARRSKGFRVTINCTLFSGETPDHVAAFFDGMAAGIGRHLVSPGLQLFTMRSAGTFSGAQRPATAVQRDSSVGKEERRFPASRWSFKPLRPVSRLLAVTRRTVPPRGEADLQHFRLAAPM